MKQRIRLTENELKRVIKESVKRIIMEMDDVDGMSPQVDIAKIHNDLMRAGLREISDEYNGEGSNYSNEDDMFDESRPIEDAEIFLGPNGPELLQQSDECYQWFIDFDNRVYCSENVFQSQDDAENDCNQYIDYLNENGADFEAYIDSFWSEDSDSFESDTVLYYNKDEDGDGFWMD